LHILIWTGFVEYDCISPTYLQVFGTSDGGRYAIIIFVVQDGSGAAAQR
jgi:hypothetical protein